MIKKSIRMLAWWSFWAAWTGSYFAPYGRVAYAIDANQGITQQQAAEKLAKLKSQRCSFSQYVGYFVANPYAAARCRLITTSISKLEYFISFKSDDSILSSLSALDNVGGPSSLAVYHLRELVSRADGEAFKAVKMHRKLCENKVRTSSEFTDVDFVAPASWCARHKKQVELLSTARKALQQALNQADADEYQTPDQKHLTDYQQYLDD